MKISNIIALIFLFTFGNIICTNIMERTIICDKVNLPTTFNSLSYLDFNGEFEIFDSFITSYDWMSHEISFKLNETSAVRFYVAPKDSVDIDLWLYLNTTPITYLQHSSLGVGGEEVIQAVLNPGTYFLQFIFIGSPTSQCETLDFEASIVPMSRLLERTSQYVCPSQSVYPQIDFELFENTNEWNVKFDGGNTDFIAPRDSSTNTLEVKFLKGYNFTVPSTSEPWRVSIQMGFNFLTSGSLGLIIIPNNGDLKLCSKEEGCTIGVDDRLNYNVIKTVLTGGNYTLWIYDTIGEQNATLAPCTPFSFKVDIQKLPQTESFLTCTNSKLPTNLNAPGLMDSTGSSQYFYFQEKVLVSPRFDRMNFVVQNESYFRVWINEHRLDLDVYLLDASQSIIAASYSFLQEENIAMVLPPGNYYLSLVVFGSFTPQFCETYDMLFSLATVNDTLGFCGSSQGISIEFPDFTDELASNQYYSFNGNNQIFTFQYSPPFNGSRVIASQNFHINQSFAMRVAIDYNFIHGDLEFILTNTNNSVVLRADHNQNVLYFSQVLGAGNYTLQISTGQVQAGYNADNLSKFPSCYQFKFFVEFDPAANINTDTNTICWNSLNLPTDLNTPAFLQQSHFVHISQDFYIPKGRVVQRDIVFTVELASFFRIYTDPNAVDVDIYLLESGVQVARSIEYNKEESIVWFLDPKEEYTIRLYFFRFGQMSSNCETFRLELAIEPSSYLVSHCTATKLPLQNLIPSDPSVFPYVNEDFYTFVQTNQSFTYDIPFTVVANQSANVTDAVIIRVLTRFNFLWGHISLYIISAENNQTIATGIADQASSNDLLPLHLAGGNYTLRLSQPATSNAELERCITFSLKVVIDSIESENIGDFGCKPSTLTTTLNNAAAMNNFTGHKVHLSTVTLAKLTSNYDYADFSLTERSVLRAFIPSHPLIDIDLILARGNHNSISEIIAASLGYEEETIYKDLDPNNYVLFYRFLPFPSQSFPSASDCASFPTQIAIFPYTYLSNISSISSSCETVLPPTSITPDQQISSSFQRDPSQSLDHKIIIPVNGGGSIHFHAHLEFEFLTSNIFMYLDQPGHSKIISTMGTNFAFIDTLLSPGNWTLTLSATSSSVSNINCARGTLHYYLNTTIDPTDCGIYNALPTDFFSSQGGSSYFGGPQAADGSVVIVGDLFNIPRQNVNQYINFFVKDPSIVRIFTDAGQRIDLDIYIYNSTTDFSYNSLVEYSIGIGPTESKQILLQPLVGDNYTLSIHSYFVSTDLSPCSFFKFEFALAPLTKVIDDMACPVAFPDPEVPPEIINFYPASVVVLNSAEYIFSHQRVEQYQALHPSTPNKYVYDMQLVVHAPTLMAGMISFNFLENDFNLAIRNTNSQTVATGSLFDVNERGSFYNFASQVYAHLSPGVYTLQIMEDILSTFTNSIHHEYCHRFSFYLFFISDSADPVVSTIYPATTVNIEPSYDFNLHISFSVPIVYPNSSFWQQFITTQAPIYFLDTQDNTRTKIIPISVELQADLQTIYVLFSKNNLDFGKSYSLGIDANKFLAYNNTPFSFPNATQYVYSTRSCNCGGHGTCNTQGTCVCQYPYTGIACDSCEQGYHSAGTSCVQNVNCLNDTCNGHGSCDDSLGYPICTCFDGYSTFLEDHCSICASDYSGYPDCKPNVNPIPVHCDAKLIPTSFDGPGYLADDGRLHIFDDYYIDYQHYKHDIFFSLSKDSLIRIYIEPHVIDIDLWLYQLREDNTIASVIYMGIGINGEETLYKILSGKTSLNTNSKYQITLRYYNPNPTLVQGLNCEAANFEFAIQPVDLATTESHQFLNNICTGQNKNPVIEQLEEGAVITNQDNVEFEGSYFTVQPVTTGGINYFFNRTFQIVAEPSEVAHISVELGDRFLTGDIAVVLEHQTTGETTVCSSHSPNCEFGYNSYNLNHLDARVPSGNYTLRFYEPNPQNSSISPCSAYSLKLSIKFVAAADELYNCPGTMLLPATFNEPGYLDPSGNMHISDDFLLGQYIGRFQLATESLFRFTTNSEYGWTATLYNSSWQIITSVSQEPDDFQDLNAMLPNGSYYFSLFYSFSDSTLDICQSSRVEFQISPHMGGNTNNLVCPFSGIDSTPSLPDVLPLNSYVFPNSTTTFYSFRTTAGLVWSYNFTLPQNSFISTSVSSQFLLSDLTLKLFQTRDDDGSDYVSVGINDFNHNFVREELAAGTYMLAIYLPNDSLNPHLRCYGFNFNFSIQNSTDNTCINGIDLNNFNSLNNFRFLRSEKNINFQSSNFLVPQDLVFNIRKTIDLSTFVRSSLRVFVAPHQRIDIDLFLYKVDDTGRSIVTQAPNGFKGEETIVATLEVGTRYQIEISFWNWNSGQHLEPCSMFDMELDVSPLNPLPQICQNGAHWPVPPPTTGMPTTPYTYSDVYSLNGEHFYYQQQINALASKTYSFNLNAHANIYVRVGYDFTSGDLFLKLIDQSNNEIIAYGVNSINRNELRAKGVAPGNYSLVITETVINNRDIIGCSPFTYYISVQKDTSNTVEFFGYPLPSSLDTISYLAYNNRVELNNFYIAFDPNKPGDVSTNFTINSNSYLRVSSFFLESSEKINITLTSGNNVVTNAFSHFNVQLNAGSQYTLTFSVPRFFYLASDPIPMNLQLVIEPITQINADVNTYTPISTCKTQVFPSQISLSSSGYYSSNTIVSLSSSSVPVTESNIVVYNFTITQPSVIYTSAETNFLTNYISSNLVKGGILSFPGFTSSNINQIDRVIDAGNYALIFTYNNVFQQPLRCFIYKLSIFIRPYSVNGPHADCSNYDLLPVDLNTVQGGSLPFGGPINNGELSFHGNSFLFPSTMGAQEYINMTITNDTIASVFIRSRTNLRITSQVQQDSSSIDPVFSLQGTTSSTFRSYHIPAQSTSKYALALSFYDVTQYSVCPFFSLDILLSKKTTLQSYFLCPPSFTAKLPDQVVAINSNGFAHQSIRTYIPSQSTLSSYNVTITVSVVSRLQLDVNFNSRLSYFNVSLTNLQTNRTTDLSLDIITNKNSETDLKRYLNAFIRPGSYIITVNQPTFRTSDFSFDSSRVYCLPFEWELFVIPYANQSTYLSVSPSSGYKISPVNNIVLSLSFSRAIYDSIHNLITSENLQPLLTGINLASSSVVINPKSITTTNNVDFTFTFDQLQLSAGSNYQLNLIPNKVYDYANASVILPTTNTYSILSGQCGGHGNLDNNYNCKCNTGYAGSVGPCTSCDIGYKNIADSTDSLTCVKDGADVCQTSSCGCSYTKEEPDVCIPLGRCNDSTGKVVCNCTSSYKGAHCEFCANGYQNTYPQCQPPPCVPGCQNGGVCNNGICKCVGNWAGSTCNVCKSDYTGVNCETFVVPGITTQYKYLIIGGILFLILLSLVVVGYFVLRYIRSRRDRSRIVFDLGDGDDDDFFNDNNNTALELKNINTEGISKAVNGDDEDKEDI
eukprot:TRINITY_DN2090_c0_g1_i1.p1 TRINITY_DN2090_c0_g1~~TRINITY_DN2090_c0_g1_i1.p1  ORF type:complete len:3438 (-),score=854.08 TRINITY_DN2090_c0_g1_i1:40-10353(-)